MFLKNINKILSKQYKKRLFYIFIFSICLIFELFSLNIMYYILNYFSDTNNQAGKLLDIIYSLPKFLFY